MGQGLHTKMIQVSPWGNRDGAGFTHTKMIQVSPWGKRDGSGFTHKDDRGEFHGGTEMGQG